MCQKIRILALSGGGARGIFQAQFLTKLNQNIRQNYSQKNLWDFFDLFAGTSTGSIVAAALAMHIPPEKIVELYDKNLGIIFQKTFLAVLKRGGRYNGNILRDKLQEIFGNQIIGDVRSDLFITATSLDNYDGTYFTNRGDQSLKEVPLVDAILASTAAPTYFPAYKPSSQERNYIDGGMWANAPALAAISFVNKDLGYAFEDIQMLCLGTGKAPTGETLKEYNSRSMLSVTGISNILDVLFNAQEQFSEAMSKQILDKPSILIINPTLSEKLSMDDFGKAKEVLMPKADAEFTNHRQEIGNFLERGLHTQKKGIRPTEFTLRGVKKAGLTSFIPTRDDYIYFRKEGTSIASYIETAKNDLTMVSITLMTGVNFEHVFTTVKELIRNGVTVKISLLNPKNESLMTATTPLFHDMKNGDLSKRIEKSLSELVKLKSDLSSEDKKRFFIRVHNALPFGSVIMIDCEDVNQKRGRIQIETKPYDQPYNSSFAFEITNYEGNNLFRNIYNGYKKLIDDGQEWTEIIID